MRRIILSVSVSLDGFFEGPGRTLDWHMVDDELHEHFNEQSRGMGAFLLGRVNYELMESVWPTADSDPASTGPERDFAGIWRETPKIVYSRTLERADGNATIRREVDPEEILALKAQPGGDMGVGGADLAAAFRQHDLIDDYRIYVHPVLLGSGRPLFSPADSRTSLRLAGTRTFGNGVVMLHHERVAAGSPA